MMLVAPPYTCANSLRQSASHEQRQYNRASEGVLITEHSRWNIKQRMMLGEERGSGQGYGNTRGL
jgi:hypothetical protein